MVAVVEYETVSSVLSDNDEGIVTELSWDNTLGDPEIPNLVSVDDESGTFGKVSARAVLTDATVTLTPE